ncbi:MAG TPA: transporter substrate-binding domain-containing protein [Nevskiaceae bacterium]|nr:transporter substrate-binding domain-containing protein [Nevskiaceae bacterium]
MKKLACVIAGLMSVGVFAAGTASTAKVVRVGFSAEPYPPFSYKSPDGKWTGFELQMQHAACKAAGMDCEPTPTAWSGIIPALTIGKIDAIMNSVTITPERLKKIDFSRPYFVQHLEFVAPTGMALGTPADLKGKLLGVQGATLAATFTHQKLVPLGVQVKIYNTQEQLSRDLEAGRVDLMIAENVYTTGYVKTHKGMHEVAVPGAPLQKVAVGLRKGDTSLEKKFNAGIEAVLKDGTCRRLSEQFVGFDVCPQP